MQNVTNKMNNFENFIKTQESTDMFEKIWPTIQDTMDNYLKPEEGTVNGKNITLLGKWIEEQIVKKYEILEKEQENILEKEPKTPPVESSVEKEPNTPIIESPVVVITPQKRKRTTKEVAIDEENTQTHSDQSETTDDEPFEKDTKKNKKIENKNKKTNIKNIENIKNVKLVKKEKESLKGLAIRICRSISSNKNPSNYKNQEILRMENQIILKSNEDNIKIVFDNMISQDQYHVQQVSDAFDKQKNAIFHYYETLLKAYQSKENQIDFFRDHPEMQKMLSVNPIEDTQNEEEEEKARGKVSLLLVNP
jgi:hypothetical protein